MLSLLKKDLNIVPKEARDITTPSQEWQKAVWESTKYTPDITLLEQYSYQRCFFYDEFMDNHRCHGLIKDNARYIGAAFTEEPYSLWKTRKGEHSQAVLLDKDYLNAGKHSVGKLLVKGQLHMVRPQMFPIIDTHKVNGVQFVRKRVKVTRHYRVLPSHVWYATSVWAWMWIGNNGYWEDLTSDFMMKPCRSFVPNDESIFEDYYLFSRLELNDF